MTKGQELRKCPFCGNEATLCVDHSEWPPTRYRIVCERCGAAVSAHTIEGADVLWNARTDDWVSVDERLPPSDARVNVIMKDMKDALEHHRYIRTGRRGIFDNWHIDDDVFDTEENRFPVTHWRLLPEPPQVMALKVAKCTCGEEKTVTENGRTRFCSYCGEDWRAEPSDIPESEPKNHTVVSACIATGEEYRESESVTCYRDYNSPLCLPAAALCERIVAEWAAWWHWNVNCLAGKAMEKLDKSTE